MLFIKCNGILSVSGGRKTTPSTANSSEQIFSRLTTGTIFNTNQSAWSLGKRRLMVTFAASVNGNLIYSMEFFE